MNLKQLLSKSAILGAGGKMGSGILLLIARQAAIWKLEDPDYMPEVLALDVSQEQLNAILKYIEKQSLKYAGKKAGELAAQFPGKGEEEIPGLFAETVLATIRTSTDISDARQSKLIFEAVNEDKDLKVKLYRTIDKDNPNKPFFLTNTSSVPIHLLNRDAGLEGRIIGFHFYNPPAVQKLVEIIAPQETVPALKEIALELAKDLRKVVVPAHDVAGFIGNGHFMRDVLFGFAQAEQIQPETGWPGAFLAVDTVTREYLIRPMGIFQLCDYVGLDVVRFIMQVMNPHFPDEELHSDHLDRMTSQGILGGQNPDGSQKNGIFSYADGKINGVYDPSSKKYIPLKDLKPEVLKYLGEKPENLRPWKEVIRDPERDRYLSSFFAGIKGMETNGAQLAIGFGKNSSEIGRKLVRDGVALSEQDVNTVLLTGFYHAFGVINQYF